MLTIYSDILRSDWIRQNDRILSKMSCNLIGYDKSSIFGYIQYALIILSIYPAHCTQYTETATNIPKYLQNLKFRGNNIPIDFKPKNARKTTKTE